MQQTEDKLINVVRDFYLPPIADFLGVPVRINDFKWEVPQGQLIATVTADNRVSRPLVIHGSVMVNGSGSMLRAIQAELDRMKWLLKADLERPKVYGTGPIEQFVKVYYTEDMKKQWNQPSPLMELLTKTSKEMQTIMGNSFMGNSYTGGYGPLYRIPVQSEGARIGDYAYRDVTKKQARAYLKGLRKHARLVEKALAG